MQGAMWFGSQKDKNEMPLEGELQLTDVFANYHLHVDGENEQVSWQFYISKSILR